MKSPAPDVACREAILGWSSVRELSVFANSGHGYCNSDHGSGIYYPEDLDEYQRAVDGLIIPKGYVLVFGYTTVFPPGYRLVVKEETYLRVLESVLAESGYASESNDVSELLRSLT